MCGIIGYKGNKEASNILLNSIKRLEYRGYDSVGMAISDNGIIKVLKDEGKVNEVDNKLNFTSLKGKTGIAHTRWATTGAVNQVNSHPHESQNKKIAAVHNGIIENYQELKKELVNKGYKFLSATDTEVIPQLVEYNMHKGDSFKQAVVNALKRIEGSYAIVIMHEDEMIGARRGSPLVLGLGDKEYYLASDVPAFLEYTNKAVYLDDEEYAVITEDYKIYDLNTDEKIEKKIVEIEWDTEQAKKGKYAHYMLKEVNEQKNTIKRAVEQSNELIQKATSMINEAYGVFLIGCGTSYHACVSAAYIFSKVAKKHVNVLLASEFRNYEHFLTKDTLVIGVSQSGETADLLDAVSFAKKHACKTMSIVNVLGSTLTRLCDINIMMNSGPEICVLSTKSYTSQLAILTLLAYSSNNMLKQGRKIILEAGGHVERIIKENTEPLKRLAEKIKDNKSLFLIGRDLAYPSALEGALKIKEVSYVHAEGFAGAELKHGTIALIEEGTPVIALNTKSTSKLIMNNVMEVKARGAFVIGINSENNEAYDYFIKVPSAGTADPILMIIPIQLLSYYLALSKGLDPDKPRNLAKSVTVK